MKPRATGVIKAMEYFEIAPMPSAIPNPHHAPRRPATSRAAAVSGC